MLAERREPGARRVPRRLGPDVDPQALGRRGEAGRIEVAGAGDEQLRGQRGDAALCLVLGRGAGIGQEVDGHELAIGQRHEPDAQAVRQPMADEVGEPIRARSPRRRSLGDHALASASAAASTWIEAASAASAASCSARVTGSAGTYWSATRLSGLIQDAIAACTRLASTAA